MIWTAAQCRAILCTLENAPGPLTPRDLHDFAGAELDRPGLVTVYRNLSRLEEQTEVIAVHLPNDTICYELTGRGRHHHFRREVCRRLFELEPSCPVAVLEGAALLGEFQV